jgi:hypothetical protein
MSDNIAIIKFEEGWEQDGVGGDGMPLYKPVLKIRKSVPPCTEVCYVATPEDREEFPEAYRHFEKQQEGRRPNVEGYPLALWPVIAPADYQNCAAREIYTVEQLAQLANKRSGNDIPPPVLELAKRAKKMIDLQKEHGRFEAVIEKLTGERDALAEDLKEAHATISAQNSMIARLQTRAA